MTSESIANALTKKKELSSIRKKLIVHGIDILICDGRNYLCLFLLSLLLHRFTDAVVFAVLLSVLRSRTGGWHANTPNKCFLFYQLSFLLFCLFSSFEFPFIYHILMIISSAYILVNSPVEHVFNPLSSS